MRVGVDVSPLVQTRAGTARYLRGLLDHIGGSIDVVPLSFGGAGRFTAAVRDLAWYPLALPLRARGLDVLHCPTFRAPLRSPAPLVVTVHDLAVLRHPDAFRAWARRYGAVAVPRVVRAADRLIAVSEFTRRELVELLGVDDGKIRVVPNAVGEPFGPGGPRAEGEYVLAVGTVEPRKNLRRLAEAAGRLGLELRVVGSIGWGPAEDVADRRRVRHLGFVPDEDVAALYRGALCVAYPSLYEGFGLPVLEAMACGAPVVTSRGTATEEVAGGAAVLVDPLDAEAIAAGIGEAIRRRDELRDAGLERARGFSWDAVAAATRDVYRELT